MRKIITKRLIYRNMITNEISYGAEEYDGNLPNWAILNAVYTLDKHEWCTNCMGLYQLNSKGEIVYQITVEDFAHYEKSWLNLLSDSIKRILRI